MSRENIQTGPAAVAEYVRDFLAQWTDFRIEAEELLQVGDGVVVKERQRGTGKSHVRWVDSREAALEAARSAR